MARADHLVLAAPITPATQHLLNAERLARMKATAHIVNVGRGGLIDQDALLAELPLTAAIFAVALVWQRLRRR